MPGDSGVLVVTRVRSTATICTRDRGCNGHPAFPTPSLGEKFINASDALRREGKVVSGTKTTSLRGAKRRSNPYFLCGEMDCFAPPAMTVWPLDERSYAVPANAGTHKRCYLCLAHWSIPSVTTNASGYGSLRSQGRRKSLDPSLRGAKRRSNPYFLCGEMDCFAEPVIGRRSAPTRWLAM